MSSSVVPKHRKKANLDISILTSLEQHLRSKYRWIADPCTLRENGGWSLVTDSTIAAESRQHSVQRAGHGTWPRNRLLRNPLNPGLDCVQERYYYHYLHRTDTDEQGLRAHAKSGPSPGSLGPRKACGSIWAPPGPPGPPARLLNPTLEGKKKTPKVHRQRSSSCGSSSQNLMGTSAFTQHCYIYCGTCQQSCTMYFVAATAPAVV